MRQPALAFCSSRGPSRRSIIIQHNAEPAFPRRAGRLQGGPTYPRPPALNAAPAASARSRVGRPTRDPDRRLQRSPSAGEGSPGRPWDRLQGKPAYPAPRAGRLPLLLSRRRVEVQGSATYPAPRPPPDSHRVQASVSSSSPPRASRLSVSFSCHSARRRLPGRPGYPTPSRPGEQQPGEPPAPPPSTPGPPGPLRGPPWGGRRVGEIEAKDGLPSADRNNKATLLLTGPFRTAKSSAKDLTPLVLKLQYAKYRDALRAPRNNRLLRR